MSLSFLSAIFIMAGKKQFSVLNGRNYWPGLCDALRDLVPFVQFKKRETSH